MADNLYWVGPVTWRKKHTPTVVLQIALSGEVLKKIRDPWDDFDEGEKRPFNEEFVAVGEHDLIEKIFAQKTWG